MPLPVILEVPGILEMSDALYPQYEHVVVDTLFMAMFGYDPAEVCDLIDLNDDHVCESPQCHECGGVVNTYEYILFYCTGRV